METPKVKAEFDQADYDALLKHYYEPIVQHNVELPGGRTLRRQTSPPRINQESPGFRALRKTIEGLKKSNAVSKIYQLLRELNAWETRPPSLGGALPSWQRGLAEESAVTETIDLTAEETVIDVDTYIIDVLLVGVVRPKPDPDGGAPRMVAVAEPAPFQVKREADGGEQSGAETDDYEAAPLVASQDGDSQDEEPRPRAAGNAATAPTPASATMSARYNPEPPAGAMLDKAVAWDGEWYHSGSKKLRPLWVVKDPDGFRVRWSDRTECVVDKDEVRQHGKRMKPVPASPAPAPTRGKPAAAKAPSKKATVAKAAPTKAKTKAPVKASVTKKKASKPKRKPTIEFLEFRVILHSFDEEDDADEEELIRVAMPGPLRCDNEHKFRARAAKESDWFDINEDQALDVGWNIGLADEFEELNHEELGGEVQWGDCADSIEAFERGEDRLDKGCSYLWWWGIGLQTRRKPGYTPPPQTPGTRERAVRGTVQFRVLDAEFRVPSKAELRDGDACRVDYWPTRSHWLV